MAPIVLAATLVAAPAGASTVDPRTLVLRQGDVPGGFRLDHAESGLRTNAAEVREEPRLEPLFRKWKRLTGYEVAYEKGEAKLESRVDVLVGRAGARQMLDWYDREVRKAGLRGLRRTMGSVGEQAWIYGSPFPTTVTIVVWRFGRVFSGVLGQGPTRARVLELARAQQRRIAEALR